MRIPRDMKKKTSVRLCEENVEQQTSSILINASQTAGASLKAINHTLAESVLALPGYVKCPSDVVWGMNFLQMDCKSPKHPY